MKSLKKDCETLIGSKDIILSGFLLVDKPDIAAVDVISGNQPRNLAISKINQRYCVEVLLIWFQCFFVLRDLRPCMNFLSFVEQ